MLGIHHVTAIAGDPVKNLSFYSRDLGLRFVKKTVNFDDPSTYHFYYGDETGSPGTILTFFPWTNATAGHRGVGETRQTAFRVPLRSIGYWTQRFIEKGIPYQTLEKRFGESHRLPRCGRRTAGADDREADSHPRPASDRTEGPQVLPLDLLPRTRRRSVRDRDRYSRICGRRAGRGPWSGLGAAELSRTASQGDREPLRPRHPQRRSAACRRLHQGYATAPGRRDRARRQRQ